MFKVDILAYAGRSHATATWGGGGAGGVRRPRPMWRYVAFSGFARGPLAQETPMSGY